MATGMFAKAATCDWPPPPSWEAPGIDASNSGRAGDESPLFSHRSRPAIARHRAGFSDRHFIRGY